MAGCWAKTAPFATSQAANAADSSREMAEIGFGRFGTWKTLKFQWDGVRDI